MEEFKVFYTVKEAHINQDANPNVEIYEIDKAVFKGLKKIQQDAVEDKSNFISVKLNIVETENKEKEENKEK